MPDVGVDAIKAAHGRHVEAHAEHERAVDDHAAGHYELAAEQLAAEQATWGDGAGQ